MLFKKALRRNTCLENSSFFTEGLTEIHVTPAVAKFENSLTMQPDDGVRICCRTPLLMKDLEFRLKAFVRCLAPLPS